VGFSSLTLTMVFAVYAVAALAALLVVGRLSDSIGRKPVLITAQIGRLTGITLTFGMTAGVPGSALLGQLVVHPLVIPYMVVGVGTVITMAGTALMPEPLAERKPLNLRVRPRVRRGWPSRPSAVETC
jgi:MFS family permease